MYTIQLFLHSLIFLFSKICNFVNSRANMDNNTTDMDNDNNTTNCPVKKHIEYFAKKDGSLTDASMRCPHYNQNIRSGVSTKISAIQNLLYRRNLKHNVDDL